MPSLRLQHVWGFTVHTCIYTVPAARVPDIPHVYPAHNTCSARVCPLQTKCTLDYTRVSTLHVSGYTCLQTTRVTILHVSADYTRVLGDCRRRCSCWSRDPVPAPRLHCSALSAAARPAQSWPDRAGGGCWLVCCYTGYHQVTYTSVQQEAHP